MARELAILVTARNMASGVLRDVRGDIKGIQSEAKRGLQNTARNVAFLGGAAAVGLGALVVKSVKDASQLEQAVGAADSVFGKHVDTLHEWGTVAAQEAGLSQRAVLQMGAVVGAQLQGMGFAQDEAAEHTVNLEKRAADLAATFGGTTTEAIESISSLLRGERDPIEKYGVSLKQVDINARVAEKGLDTSTAAAKKQSEAIAALELLYESTGKAEGQFARETDSLAGTQARLGAELENTRATIGEALLPSISRVAERLNEALAKHQPEIKAFAAELPGIFDDLLGIVEALPWGAIKSTFELMGRGAQLALDAFSKMPPWIQTAVLTGWGLNKLSGGALGNIAGSLLGRGMGALRGSSPATPMFTKEVGFGGGPGLPGGRGGGGFLGSLGRGLATGAAVAGPALAATAGVMTVEFVGNAQRQAEGINDKLASLPRDTASEIDASIAKVVDAQEAANSGPLATLVSNGTGLNKRLDSELSELRTMRSDLQSDSARMAALMTGQAAEARSFDGAMLGNLRTIAAKRTEFNPVINVHNTVATSVNVNTAAVVRAVQVYSKTVNARQGTSPTVN